MGSIAPPELRRVLLLGERADFYGGGQRSLRDLACALLTSSWIPIAVLPGPGPLADDLRAHGIQVHHLPLPRVAPFGRGGCLRTVRRLATLLVAERAAIVHSDAPRGAFYGGLAARFAGRKHLWHLRASRSGAAGSDRLLHALSHRVIAVSRAAATRSAALRRSRRIVVIPTGIRPPDFLDRRSARAVLDLPQDRLIAGVVGRVEADKGGDDALLVAARLVQAVPGSILAFLGPGEAGSTWRGALEERVEALGIAGSVLFLGERPEAMSLFRAFDLILHPSRHEALPRVLIEALWASVPVAAYAVGGVGEVVGAGVDAGGLLAPPGRAESLARHAERLALDPDLRSAFGVAGQHRARERFSIDAMRDAIVAQYDRLAPGALEAARDTPRVAA